MILAAIHVFHCIWRVTRSGFLLLFNVFGPTARNLCFSTVSEGILGDVISTWHQNQFYLTSGILQPMRQKRVFSHWFWWTSGGSRFYQTSESNLPDIGKLLAAYATETYNMPGAGDSGPMYCNLAKKNQSKNMLNLKIPPSKPSKIIQKRKKTIKKLLANHKNNWWPHKLIHLWCIKTPFFVTYRSFSWLIDKSF